MRDSYPRRTLLPLFCIAALGGLIMDSSGASYDFEGLGLLAPVSTAPGWVASEADSGVTSPLAWATSWDRPGLGSSMAGAIGGAFDVPTSPTYAISYQFPMGLANPLTPPTISFDMSIFDSTNGYPWRDSFGFSIKDGSGGSFITAEFRPVVQSATPGDPLDPAGAWEVRYNVRGGGSVSTLVGLMESEVYTMQVTFTNTGVGFAFDHAGSAPLANQFFGTPFGYNPLTESISGLSFSWTKTASNPDFGDNYVVVDNISAVPEPGTAFLAVLAAALPLFIRRRRAAAC